MMKTNYQELYIELLLFQVEDVLTLSLGGKDSDAQDDIFAPNN